MAMQALRLRLRISVSELGYRALSGNLGGSAKDALFEVQLKA
jgi:hypothetical protein